MLKYLTYELLRVCPAGILRYWRHISWLLSVRGITLLSVPAITLLLVLRLDTFESSFTTAHFKFLVTTISFIGEYVNVHQLVRYSHTLQHNQKSLNVGMQVFPKFVEPIKSYKSECVYVTKKHTRLFGPFVTQSAFHVCTVELCTVWNLEDSCRLKTPLCSLSYANGHSSSKP